ncbi:perlucin-like protein [Uranotaenia lowii]|uniref:perlucin-like protein n=1 Tax=Uranotaenia lowii TaxID=190385 RepID=UPI00247AAAEF|nr:perlucin-like protein [Uranotaenia lowii]
MKSLVVFVSIICLSSAAKYSIPSIKANWYKAFELCASQGQRLVSIGSQKQQDEVVAFIKTTDKFVPFIRFWIGASDLAEKGTHTWMNSGRLASYSNWGPGEPNGLQSERCVEMIYNQATEHNFFWNDNECDKQFYFVCENVDDCVSPF